MNPALRASVARRIGTISFYSLLVLIALVAIPYGTAEPWWKALFQCMVFVLAGLCVIQRLLWRDGTSYDRHLLFPGLALITFALLQTLPWAYYNAAATVNVGRTVSADPFQTRLFVNQLSALILAGSLLVIHTTSQRRLRHLVQLIIAVGVVSACFGLLRQATQLETGFGLPYLPLGFGYGQFINANHFAFLVEMSMGLALGIVVCRGVSGVRLALYLLGALPMWIALIRSNSRAGVLSVLCQVLFLAVLLGSKPLSRENREVRQSGIWSFRTGRPGAIRAILVIAMLVAAATTIIFVGGDPLIQKLDSISIELDHKSTEPFGQEKGAQGFGAPNMDVRVLEYLRLNIWRPTWGLIKDHPIAGVGFGGYWIAIARYHHSSGWTTPQEAHSDYLELLASGGLIGLFLGIWFVVAFVRTVRRKIRAADGYNRAVTAGALAGILPVAVHSLVDYGLHITINALLFTALVSIVIINARKDDVCLQKEDS